MIQLNSYHVKTQIHESNNSIVYRGVREADNHPVILKLLQGDPPTAPQLTHYRQEYDMTRRFDLAGVIKAYDLLPYHHSLVMVLEDFGGQSLKSLGLAGQLTLAEFLPLAIQLCDILGQVHEQKIMHKDINPANVVYNPTTNIMKLIDFGISSRLSREYLTFHNADNLQGTLAYISPEQTGRMNRAIDYRTDLYSLGVTLYELLTGQLPFEESDPLALIHAHMAKTPLAPLEQLRIKNYELKIDATSLLPTPYSLLSDIILKLLAKNAEDRYQSAFGVKWDLEQVKEYEVRSREYAISSNLLPTPYSLLLGTRDFSGRFQIPQKLYGREQEIEMLLAAFERVTKGVRNDELGVRSEPLITHHSSLITIAGYSGVGKSALVYEVYKPITARRGHFIQGKFDQFQRNIPYFALIQAFDEFVKLLVTKSPAELQTWREKIQHAAGNIGKVLTDLIPSLELIIGAQPNAPELDEVSAQNRFHYAIKNLVKTMAQPNHPLVMFIDDWQWADLPSIHLLETLLLDNSIQHLLVIAAYRDNEVNTSHSFMTTVENIKKAGSVVQAIELHNLTVEDIEDFMRDALPGNSLIGFSDLVTLVYEKTQGNAFFVAQFLQTLYEEGLLKFDFTQLAWQWDIDQIRTQGMTDNVVELLTQKVQKLPQATQQILQLAACMGNRFTLILLSMVAQQEAPATNQVLEPAVLEGLLIPNQSHFQQADSLSLTYHFAHDRIQQAAYTLISEEEKQRVHLQIGRLLLAKLQTSVVLETAEILEMIFEITNHWNKGRDLVTDKKECLILSRLNFMAGHKAKTSAAYKPALTYYHIGLEQLPADSWQTEYQLTLTLYTGAATATCLMGDFEQTEELTQTALRYAQTILDKLMLYEVQIQAQIAQNNPLQALKIGLAVLKEFGISLPLKPSQVEIGMGLLKTMLRLRNTHPEDLLALPNLTHHPHKVATIRLLTILSSAAYIAEPTLFALFVFAGIKLSLPDGHVFLPQTYAGYGMILMGVVGDIEQGYQFGQTALRLVEHVDYQTSQARVTFTVYYLIKPWKDHLRDSIEPLYRGYQLCLESGDLEFANWCLNMHCIVPFFTGESLAQVHQRLVLFQESVKQLHQEKALDLLNMFWQVILNWRGETHHISQLRGTMYDEVARLPYYIAQHDVTALNVIYTYKSILAYNFREYHHALEYTQQAAINLEAAMGNPFTPLFYFYDSLTHLALYPTVSKVQQLNWRFRVWRNQRKIKHWATHAPMNFLHKYYLVEAEWARVLGQDGAAGDYYDKAIALAKEHGYLNEEALAYELASQFYLGKNRIELANYYLRQAYHAYQQWGAVAKCQQLEQYHPQLVPLSLPTNLAKSPTVTSTTTSKQLDFNSITKASQTISGEIKLESLLEKMMHIIMENAGAQRGLLILRHQNEWLLQAEVNEEGIEVLQAIPLEAIGGKSNLPKLSLTISRYVEHTQQALVSDDARRENRFSQTEYVQKFQPKSVLCVPMINQGQMMGFIYLENNLTTGAFTPERVEIVQLLGTQAAISINNLQTLAMQAEQAQLRLRNELLEQLNADKDKFFSIVAHDLKSPFKPSLDHAETLIKLADSLPRPQIKTLATELHVSAQNTLGLLENLLQWARLQMGRMDYQPISLNLRQVLNQTITLFAATAKNKGIDLTCLLQVDIMVQADEYMLATIIRNLTNNALKFTRSEGQVTLSAHPSASKETPGEWVEVWVSDNGVGISPENLAKLFKIGEHVSTPGTKQEKGTGLGLVMCQEMVHQHGGKIWVKTQSGEGTTFKFTMPASAPLPFGNWQLSPQEAPKTVSKYYAIPPQADLEALYMFAERGNIHKVEEWLQLIEGQDEQYQPFCTEVAQYVELFDWASLMDLVAPHLPASDKK